jgi:hypothetical protein
LFTNAGKALAEERHQLMVLFFESWLDEIGEFNA